MTIKARMICQSVMDHNHGSADPAVPGEKYGESVRLSAVYSTDPASPNYSFSSATPYAELNMAVNNKEAFGAFVPGQSYDLTFEPTAA